MASTGRWEMRAQLLERAVGVIGNNSAEGEGPREMEMESASAGMD